MSFNFPDPSALKSCRGLWSQKSLVEIASGIVSEVEQKSVHAGCQKLVHGIGKLEVCSPGEFGKADITGSVIDHECRIHAVDRNLSSGYFERDISTVPSDGNTDFRTCRPLHSGDHAVLRCLVPCYDRSVYFQYPVTLQESGLLRWSSRDDTQDYGRVVRDIELNAYAFEISGKFRFGGFQLYRRKIYRMRIKL